MRAGNAGAPEAPARTHPPLESIMLRLNPTWMAGASLLLLSALAAGTAIGQSNQSNSQARTLWQATDWTLQGPIGHSHEEAAAANTAYVNGSSLPAGWSLLEDHGTATIVETGISTPSGDYGILVTCTESSTDLDSLEVYVNGILEQTATRANGLILDRGGLAVASVPMMVGPGLPVSFTLNWKSGGSTTRVDSLDLN